MLRLASLLSVLAVGCTTLSPVPEGVCGNGVLEGEEVCDGTPGCAGPTSPRACQAYTCASAEDCPAGLPACGADGVCRRALGSFRLASSIPVGFEVISLGDVDGLCVELEGGSRRCPAELVGSRPSVGETAVVYLDGAFQPVQTVGLGTGPRPPVVTELDAGASPRVEDLVVLPDGGVATYHGRSERIFLPDLLAAYPALDLGAVVPADAKTLAPQRLSLMPGTPGAAVDAVGWLAERADGKTDLSVASFCLACGGAALPGRPGEIAVSDLTGFVGCDEIVVAPLGGSDVQVRTCDESQPATYAIATTSLGAQAAIVGPPRPALATTLFGQRATVVPWTDGAGTHTALVDSLLGIPFNKPGPPLDPGVTLLGVADLDGNGLLDLLTNEGVQLCYGADATGGSPAVEADWQCVQVAAFDPTGVAQATRVLVGGFDGADGVDVVALRDDGRAVFLSNPATSSVQELLPSSAPIADLASGDLDGDGRADLVAVTEAFPGSDASVVVFHGSDVGLDPAVLVARVPEGIDALRAFPVTPDGFDDLLLARAGQAGPLESRVYSLLLGGTGKSLASPLTLPDLRVPVVSVPLPMPDGTTRLLVVGTSLPGGGDLQVSAFDPTPTGLAPVGSPHALAAVSPGLAFQARPFTLVDERIGGALVIIPDEGNLGDPSTYGTTTLLVSPPTADCPTPADFACLGTFLSKALVFDGAVGDVDGDGRVELITVALDDTGQPVLFVFWGNDADVQPPIQLLPQVFPLQTSGSRLALVDLDPATPALEVLVNGSLGFAGKLAAVEHIQFTKQADGSREATSALADGFEWGATDLAARDLDDDGVTDLVVTYGSSFGQGHTSVYLGETSPAPLEAPAGE